MLYDAHYRPHTPYINTRAHTYAPFDRMTKRPVRGVSIGPSFSLATGRACTTRCFFFVRSGKTIIFISRKNEFEFEIMSFFSFAYIFIKRVSILYEHVSRNIINTVQPNIVMTENSTLLNFKSKRLSFNFFFF